MSPKIIHFTALSIILHALLIFLLMNVKTPNQEQQIKPKPQPIASYVFVAKSAKKKSKSAPVVMPAEINQQTPPQLAISAKPNIQQETIFSPNIPAKFAMSDYKYKPEVPLANNSSIDIQKRVSLYLENLHANELKNLAKHASKDFNTSKPIVSSTPLSINQRLKKLSATFAAPGSDIIVMSKFGSDETNVILDDTCFTITQTALDDKVWRGASVWKKSNKCGSYDKYDGQLQKSLDKYLQK